MLLDLLIKFLVTPENILGLILDVTIIVGLCCVFKAWQEEWWKSLIPVYGTYIIYKHTWVEKKWLFVIPIICNIINARSMSTMRKNLLVDVWESIRVFMERQQISVNVDVNQLVICIILFLVSALVSLVITRITYMKICESLSINNILLKIGTLLLPQVFIVVDYLYYKRTGKVIN